MAKVDKKVRGVDEQTWEEGRAAMLRRKAVSPKFTMGDFVTEAIAEKVAIEKVAKQTPQPARDQERRA